MNRKTPVSALQSRIQKAFTRRLLAKRSADEQLAAFYDEARPLAEELLKAAGWKLWTTFLNRPDDNLWRKQVGQTTYTCGWVTAITTEEQLEREA